MFSVCADGSVVWYFWCPVCMGELRFLYCDDVRLCCEKEMFKFFHGFVLEVFCLLRVWGCEGLECMLGWQRMEVCVMRICGESRDL